MKYFLSYIIIISFSLSCYAQDFQLKIVGQSLHENQIIDSLHYNEKHKNALSLHSEIESVSKKLAKLGYIENKITEQLKLNDSAYEAKISLGIKIKFVHLYIGRNNDIAKIVLHKTPQDSIFLPYIEVEKFLDETTIALEQKGFSLAKLKLTNISHKDKTLTAELQFDLETKRQLNDIVVRYADNTQKSDFPKSFLTQINRKYKNKPFNREIVKKIHGDFEKISFVAQTKYPEILFTKDATKLYVYLEKRKSNTFDGFIGFNNNENKKIILNGYLDLTLDNTLRAGEQFSVYWKSDGKQQTTFKTSLELPYLFKSPIGLKAQLTIFKQDSIYQNTKTQIDLSYFSNYNTRFYLGYQSTTSSDIQNTKSTNITDYNNEFVTATLRYSQLDHFNRLFFKKPYLDLQLGSGKRESNDKIDNSQKYRQFFIELKADYTISLNKNNNINIKTQNYFLGSSNYLNNELYRFGGINSIRGFNENSLAAHSMTSILTEYRYILSPSLYIHTILDYCALQTRSTLEKNTNLVALGAGISLQTTSGILKISIANGTSTTIKTDFYNTILHLSYNVKF